MGSLKHKRYRVTRPTMLTDAQFGAAVVNSTPDLVFGGDMTAELWFSMTDWSPAASTHQLAHMDALDNQSWIFSVHPTGRPRFAMYPTGLNASLVGLESTLGFLDIFTEAQLIQMKMIGCRVRVTLDLFAQRVLVYEYNTGPIGSGKWKLFGTMIEPNGGFVTFFNPNCGIQFAGLLASGVKNYYRARVYASSGIIFPGPGTADIRAEIDCTKRGAIKGIAAGSWQDDFGNTFTCGAFNSIGRSNSPAVYAA